MAQPKKQKLARRVNGSSPVKAWTTKRETGKKTK